MKVPRIYAILVGFISLFLIVAVRLFFLQIVDAEQYKAIHFDASICKVIEHPIRGRIYDRNMNYLTLTKMEYAILADLSKIDQPRRIAQELASILNRPYEEFYAKLKDTSQHRTVKLATCISQEQKDAVMAWKEAWKQKRESKKNKKAYGILIEETPKRLYNYDGLAGTVIGYLGRDTSGGEGLPRGLLGMERSMERMLAGQDGYSYRVRNGRGSLRPEMSLEKIDPVNGKSIVLTIDQKYQTIAEEELAKGAKKYGSDSGRCIILNPKSGEVLAMANYPSIDANRLSSYTKEEKIKARNRCVSDIYEPGSTFKLVTISAALDKGAVTPEDIFNAFDGKWKYDGEHTIQDVHGYRALSVREAFVNSSNIVCAQIADRRVGAEDFYLYARNFGFGTKTGLEVPSERQGVLRKPSSWDGSTLKHIAFGYGVSVTAIQIANAYCAILNGGVLMRPYLVKRVLEDDGRISDETVPQVIRRVVSSKTAATMREFMEEVVEKGTAKKAQIKGMRIGGKTGTTKRWVNGQYVSVPGAVSFIGGFPMDDPKVLILVVLDTPKNGTTGGDVSAPIFREIALRIINSSDDLIKKPDLNPKRTSDQDQIIVPNVKGLRVRVAKSFLMSRGFVVSLNGNGDVVREQQPAAWTRIPHSNNMSITLDADPAADKSKSAMPDVTGLSLRQAMMILKDRHILVSSAGNGVVYDQTPHPGEEIQPNGRCMIYCATRKQFSVLMENSTP